MTMVPEPPVVVGINDPEASAAALAAEEAAARHAPLVAVYVLDPRGTAAVYSRAGARTRAAPMRRHDVSHLPVVDGRGIVVGIVSRGDLLGEFMREDKVIHQDVLSEVLAHRIDDPAAVEVTVERGVVSLAGEVRFASDALYAVEASRRVPGVVDVIDLLRWTTDDRKPQVGPLF